MDLTYPVHEAEDVEEALEIARWLQEEHRYDIFRGQNRNFPLTPSIFRPGTDLEESKRQLNEFYSWIQTVPELSSAHLDLNVSLAICQHYGLPTPFLDWTTNPEVAAFFASNGPLPIVNLPELEPSVIVCASIEYLRESWKSIGPPDSSLVSVVELHVPNLWRLQAQEGLFLDVRVNPMLLEMFSGLFRITFPNDGAIKSVQPEFIYPTQKSHLETMLDEYFAQQHFRTRFSQLTALFGPVIGSERSDFHEGEPRRFRNGQLPDVHSSWKSQHARQWANEPDEIFHEVWTEKHILLELPDGLAAGSLRDDVELRLLNLLDNGDVTRKLSITWEVVDSLGQPVTVDDEDAEVNDDGSIPQRLVSDSLSLLWNGLRRLPCSRASLVRAASNLVAIELHGHQCIFGNTIGVEFDTGPARGRVLISEQRLRLCIRPDFSQLAAPVSEQEETPQDIRDILFTLSVPDKLFDFAPFSTIFVEQCVPSQVALRHYESAIVFSPLRLRCFGNS